MILYIFRIKNDNNFGIGWKMKGTEEKRLRLKHDAVRAKPNIVNVNEMDYDP